MLVNQSTALKFNDIVSIRTLAGEEIVGKFVEATSSDITLSKPLVLVSRMTGESTIEVGFTHLPFMNSTEEGAPLTFLYTGLSLKAVRTRSDVAAGYLQSTTSLELPAGSSILRP